jgi:hypothetical protein
VNGSNLQPRPWVGARMFFIPDERESTLEPGFVWVLKHDPWRPRSWRVAYVADQECWFWCHAAELSAP